MNKLFFFGFLLFFIWGNVWAQRTLKSVFEENAAMKTVKITTKDMKLLKSRMTGNFNSEAQSQKDTNFFNIRLIMKPIWTERTDGFWLYIEQASVKNLEKPYRQRVYHVFRQDKSTVVSQVYELSDPKLYVGDWKKENPLQELKPEALLSKDGCAIYLKKNKTGNFVGSTPGKECPSSLKGAKYATSEVVIMESQILSWDRGFDAADKQVWGSTEGAYEFQKQSESLN